MDRYGEILAFKSLPILKLQHQTPAWRSQSRYGYPARDERLKNNCQLAGAGWT